MTHLDLLKEVKSELSKSDPNIIECLTKLSIVIKSMEEIEKIYTKAAYSNI
jgi:hypothetical protein